MKIKSKAYVKKGHRRMSVEATPDVMAGLARLSDATGPSRSRIAELGIKALAHGDIPMLQTYASEFDKAVERGGR